MPLVRAPAVSIRIGTQLSIRTVSYWRALGEKSRDVECQLQDSGCIFLWVLHFQSVSGGLFFPNMLVCKATIGSVLFLSLTLKLATALPLSSGGAGVLSASRLDTHHTEAKKWELIRANKSGSRCQSEATAAARLSPSLVEGKLPFSFFFFFTF